MVESDPHTGPAVVGYAEACGAGVGDQVRTVLFDAYWRHGADLGSPEVLRRLLVGPILAGHSDSWPLRESGYAITLAGGPFPTGAWHCIRVWHADREQQAGGTVPALLGGGLLTALAALTALRATVLDQPGKVPAAPVPNLLELPSWATAIAIDARFLCTAGPVFEDNGGLSAYGTIRATVSEPG